MEQSREIVLFTMFLVFLLGLIIIFLFLFFQKKKNFLIQKQFEEKKKFDKEINNLQIEIREETLRNISWELHDNIGQMLTLAKIQLQSVENNDKISEVKDSIGNILNEVRALSKTINPEFIKQINLLEATKLEVDRFNRLNYIKSKLKVQGHIYQIPNNVEIVIFRILQEFFSNTIKHSQASNLDIEIFFNELELKILAKENGKGFDVENVNNSGIGILNIKKRAKLIGAEIELKSKINEGTELIIIYKTKNHEKI
jgi:signal transduction histidine kinase